MSIVIDVLTGKLLHDRAKHKKRGYVPGMERSGVTKSDSGSLLLLSRRKSAIVDR